MSWSSPWSVCSQEYYRRRVLHRPGDTCVVPTNRIRCGLPPRECRGRGTRKHCHQACCKQQVTRSYVLIERRHNVVRCSLPELQSITSTPVLSSVEGSTKRKLESIRWNTGCEQSPQWFAETSIREFVSGHNAMNTIMRTISNCYVALGSSCTRHLFCSSRSPVTFTPVSARDRDPDVRER